MWRRVVAGAMVAAMRALPTRIRRLVLPAAACCLASCASMKFERDTESSGTFRSSSISFTVLSYDFPSPAIDVARGNASDAGQPNTVIERELIFPHFGWFDWLLDIISVRYARCQGTWGFPPEREADAGATE